jgi:hypothetical protein
MSNSKKNGRSPGTQSETRICTKGVVAKKSKRSGAGASSDRPLRSIRTRQEFVEWLVSEMMHRCRSAVSTDIAAGMFDRIAEEMSEFGEIVSYSSIILDGLEAVERNAQKSRQLPAPISFLPSMMLWFHAESGSSGADAFALCMVQALDLQKSIIVQLGKRVVRFQSTSAFEKTSGVRVGVRLTRSTDLSLFGNYAWVDVPPGPALYQPRMADLT